MGVETAPKSQWAKLFLEKFDFIGKPFVFVPLILFFALLVYSNTFNAPFQFDDRITIEENPLITDMSNIPTILSGAKGTFASRPLMHVTFAINYYFGGLNPAGYHAVNLALHLINGILIFLLVTVTGGLKSYASHSQVSFAAAFSTMLFVLHPVQTEAVTYITSRSMLLVTAFFLLGMLLFVKAVKAGKRRPLYMIGLMVTSFLGMGSREDFVTFPLILFLYDLFFISGFSIRETVKHYKAYVPAVLSLGYLVFMVTNNTYDRGTDYLGLGVTQKDYFLTQLNVQWTYLRLLALPINQNIDYDYPIAGGLTELPTIFSFLGYLGLWAVCIVAARKRPVLSFSVIWFLVTLIPISFGVVFMNLRLGDVIFEHRLYLPAVGVIMGSSAALASILVKFNVIKRNIAVAVLVIILAPALSGAAYQRNADWRSKASLWEDAVGKSPRKARVQNNLGVIYHKTLGLNEKAIERFKEAIRLEPNFPDPHLNLGMLYLEDGRDDLAQREFAKPYYNLGNFYNSRGLHRKAMEQYLAAIDLYPQYAEAHNNLGILYLATFGLRGKAIEHLSNAVRLNPGLVDAHFNLGKLYLEEGLLDMAIAEFATVLKLSPGDRDAANMLDDIRRMKQ